MSSRQSDLNGRFQTDIREWVGDVEPRDETHETAPDTATFDCESGHRVLNYCRDCGVFRWFRELPGARYECSHCERIEER